ncbi:hypothetical protein V6N13_032950 [Hibiscus sabdariffa]
MSLLRRSLSSFPILSFASSSNCRTFRLAAKPCNREIVGLRTKKQQLTCNREMRKTWNEEATIHICDESTIHSYFSQASQTVYSYFDDMRVKWRPSKRLSRFAQRSEWFKHIKDVFEELFQSTAKIWSTLIDETSHKSIYTNCPEKCLLFTNDGKVKVLPNLDQGASSSSNDIDRLQQFI